MIFYLFTLRSVCGTGKSSQQTSLQCLSTINMAFSDEDKILIKTHKYTQHTQLWHRGIKIGALKMQFVCIFPTSAKYLQKIRIFNYPRYCSKTSNMLKVRWVMLSGFVANFIRFPTVQKFWKSVKILRNYRQFKAGNFFETQCSCILNGITEVVWWCAMP